MTGTALPARGSLRLRFLLAIMLWVLLGIGAIWFSATRLFASHVEQGFHEELDVHVRELGRLVDIDAQGRPVLTRPLSDPRYDEPLSGFYWQVTVPGVEPLRSGSMTRGRLDETIAHTPMIAHRRASGPTGPAITYGMLRQTEDGRDVHLVIATDQSQLDRVIDSFTRELGWWLATLATVLLITGIAIIRFGLRPLDRLGSAMARLRRGEAERLEGDFPAEIAPLVNDLNAFVRQNGEMVARARVQAGNLAHSLRTPLAVVTDEAERLAAVAETAGSGQTLLEQSHAMLQQIDYQLARARAAAAGRTPGVTSRLPQVLEPVLRAMRRLHPDREFTLDMSSGELALPVDPVDLAELASILLDNAGKWSHHHVTVTIRQSPDKVVLTIRDDGLGMTDHQIATACDIGTRFDPAKPGSGLGLAIARDIAAGMGAQLHLSQRNPGLEASVTFDLDHHG